jgi:hypothetical protein
MNFSSAHNGFRHERKYGLVLARDAEYRCQIGLRVCYPVPGLFEKARAQHEQRVPTLQNLRSDSESRKGAA